MTPIKATNCIWVMDYKSLTVTTKNATGILLFENEYEITIPPNSKVVLGAMEFGRTECDFGLIGEQSDIDFSGALCNLKINGEIIWDGELDNESFWRNKMNTSYEGCNKEIAESLKRGEHIKCRCEPICGEILQDIIVGYIACKHNCYIGSVKSYPEADPIKTETYVIDAVSMMKGLIERECEVDSHGYWISSDGTTQFHVSDWKCCGKICQEDKCTWEPWMLEEREVD